VIIFFILSGVCCFLYRSFVPQGGWSEALAFTSILLSLPLGALLAGKVLDFAGLERSKSGIFSRSALPLACVVAFNSPFFFEALSKTLSAPSAGNNISVVLHSVALSGVFAGVVSAVLIAVILTFELPFRWFAESKVNFIPALRPCALLLLISLSFHLIVDCAEILLNRFL
jgi:hypothetical protein